MRPSCVHALQLRVLLGPSVLGLACCCWDLSLGLFEVPTGLGNRLFGNPTTGAESLCRACCCCRWGFRARSVVAPRFAACMWASIWWWLCCWPPKPSVARAICSAEASCCAIRFGEDSDLMIQQAEGIAWRWGSHQGVAQLRCPRKAGTGPAHVLPCDQKAMVSSISH